MLLARHPTRDVAEGLRAGADCGWIAPAVAEELAETYRLFWALQTGARLISDAALDGSALGAGGATFLARLSGCPDTGALEARLAEAADTAAAEIAALFPTLPEAS